jgi:hypothetical protein
MFQVNGYFLAIKMLIYFFKILTMSILKYLRKNFCITSNKQISFILKLQLMKFGHRIPSINKRIAARTSVKRIIQN